MVNGGVCVCVCTVVTARRLCSLLSLSLSLRPFRPSFTVYRSPDQQAGQPGAPHRHLAVIGDDEEKGGREREGRERERENGPEDQRSRRAFCGD